VYLVGNIENSLKQLEQYIRREGYRGYDPYDGLMSPLFRMPVMRSSKLLRFGFQQVFRRIPFNLRPMLGIKKGLNPVTLGLCIQTYTYLIKIFPENADFYRSEIDSLIALLKNMISPGYDCACWGYDFDWEARYASLKAGSPTIVATGFITNALYKNYKYAGNKKSGELILRAAGFVKHLHKTYSGDGFCWSYSPFDKQAVFNASMKAARLLTQAYLVSQDDSYIDEARRAVAYVIKHQNDDGSWYYSAGDNRNWVDNFHTGYILDCLYEYVHAADDAEATKCMILGYEFYKDNFFTANDGTPLSQVLRISKFIPLSSKLHDTGRIKLIIPKYYSNRIYPTDSTSAAQSILTMTRFGDVEIAGKIAEYMLGYMYDKQGLFHYRKGKFFTNKIPYMRWSTTWMFLAMSYLLFSDG
jgi:hypothetical protein